MPAWIACTAQKRRSATFVRCCGSSPRHPSTPPSASRTDAMPRTLRAGQCAQLFVIDATSGERRLLYESRAQLFEAPNWTSVQDSRHGAKVVGWSGPGFDFVAQDEVGAPSPYENGLRVRVGRGPQLGLALSGSSFGDPHLRWPRAVSNARFKRPWFAVGVSPCGPPVCLRCVGSSWASPKPVIEQIRPLL